MKTKILIIVLASAVLISLEASRVTSSHNEKAQVAQSNDGALGGLAADDK